MGGSVSVPKPSAEERELQKQQAETLKLQREILEQQRQQQAVLLPFLAEQEGFEAVTDANGNITSIKKKPDALADMKKEIETKFAERSLKALKGELPVDPALEETLGIQERDLRNKLANQLGPGWETSSPGIEAMGNFTRSAEMLRSGARNDQLTLAEQLGMAREQGRIFSQQTAQDTLTQQANSLPMTLAGAFGQNAQGFGRAQEPFIQQRQMQLQANIANQQAKTQMFGAGLGLVGAMFSDDRVKEKIRVVGWSGGVPVWEFRYTNDPPWAVRYGHSAQEVQRVYPEMVLENDAGLKMVNYDMNPEMLAVFRSL